MAKGKLPADDLFEKSSMSFGEHLEELRKAMMKAFIWLGIGTTVGLLFANEIVKFVESPLKAAIRQFHIDQAKEQFLAANGVEPSEELADWMTLKGMMPERVFIDPQTISTVSGDSTGMNAGDAQAPIDDASAESGPDTAAQEDAVPDPTGSTPTTSQPDAGLTPDSSTPDSSTPDSSTPDSSTPGEEGKGEQDAPPEAEVISGDLDGTTTVAGETDQSNLRLATLNDEATDSSGQKLAVESPSDNPWAGIDLDKLMRLRPLLLWRPIPNKLVSLTPVEGFMIWLKAGLVAGVVIGSPGIFWHIWQFLAAGLYPHERRYVYWYLPLSLLLFLGGVCLAFFVVFRLVLGFLMTYTTGLDVEFTPRLNDYMTFALFLPLGFGLAFQLPIVMLGLHRFGLVSVNTFISQWRLAVLSMAFLSMLFTPAEIYSMIGLFVPLVGLYFFGILLCKYMPQGAGIGSPAVDPQG